MNGDEIIDRRVGGHYYVLRAHDAALRFDGGFGAARKAGRVAAGVDAPAAALDGLRHAGKVFQRMKLTLVGKAQARASIECQRRSRYFGYVMQAGAMGRVQFSIEIRLIVLRRTEQIAVEADEIAIDPLARDDVFNAIDRRSVAFGGQPRATFTVEPLELEES